VGQRRKRKRGRRAVGLGREERERGLGEFCFFFKNFSNLFKPSKHFKASHQQTKHPAFKL
jgi:hypothetical protein